MKRFIITTIVFIISFQFLYSQDGNNVWTQKGSGMGRIYCGVINPSNQNILYVAGLDSGIFKTTNGGLNWFSVNNGVTYKKVQCLAISPSSPDVLYAGTDSLGGANSGVYKTTNGGANWVLAVGGLVELAVQTLVVHTTNPNIVWACTFNAVGPAAVGLWKTTNGGTNWTPSNTGIASDNKNMLSMAINPLNPNVLYAGTSLVLPGSTGPSKIYRTNDGGATWVLSSTGLPTLTTANNPIRALDVLKSDTSIVGAALFVNELSGGFYLSINSGQTWTKKHSGLPEVAGSLLRSLSMRSANEYFVGMDGGTTTKGVWRTTNGGNNWIQFTNAVLSNLHPVRMLVFKIAGDTTLYAGTSGTTEPLQGVYDYTWPGPVPPVFYYNYMTGLNANSFPLGIAGGKMVQWLVLASEFNQPSSAPSGSISKFAFRVPTGYPLNSATYTSLYIRFGLTTITSLTSGAFHTGPMDTVYRRASVTLSAPADSWLEFVLDQPFLYNPTQSLVIEMGHCGGAGASGFPLAHTNLTGNRRVWSIGGCPFAAYAGAGTNVLNCGVWISTVTNKTPNTSQIPNEYKLEQNYPNPFNPVTKINFALPKAGFVSLKIYDILGREVVNLVNENRIAGSHTVDFDASALTSGAYFYRLESNGFVDTKKMVLIK